MIYSVPIIPEQFPITTIQRIVGKVIPLNKQNILDIKSVLSCRCMFSKNYLPDRDTVDRISKVIDDPSKLNGLSYDEILYLYKLIGSITVNIYSTDNHTEMLRDCLYRVQGLIDHHVWEMSVNY